MRDQKLKLQARRRIALGIVVAALVGLSLVAAHPATASAPPRAITWLAAGDSYSSGHGTPGATSGCQVSTAAWPVQAQSLLAGDLPLQTNGFRLAACSGATTSQFSAQAAGGRYDLVTFTFGGDDIGFADVVAQCVVVGGGGQLLNFPWLTTPVSGCPSDGDVRGRISALAGTYRQFLTYVASYATSTGGNIVVLGYPQLVAKPSMWSGVADVTGLCNGINSTDANLSRGWDGDLNATIGQAAHDLDGKINHVHMTFVNVDDQAASGENQYLYEPPGASQVHSLCGNDVSWLNGLQPAKGFHPNALGLDAMAHLAAGTIHRLDWSGLDQSAAPAGGGTSLPPPSGSTVPSGSGARNVHLGQGPAAPTGYRYAVNVSGFGANSSVSVSCYDSASPGGFYTFSLSVDGAGNGSTASQCYSGDGPDHWVVAGGVQSNHVTWGGASPAPTPPPTPAPTPVPSRTYTEQSGSHGSPTFQNPTNASGQGPTIPAMSYVQVTCKVKPASTISSAYPDGYWYKIASSPWNNAYYAVANTFWNGDVPGQTPYTHNTDFAVPDCQ